jgi:hypothetical protein
MRLGLAFVRCLRVNGRLIDLSACAISGRGPSVWTGRALQAESDDLESWSRASVPGLLMEAFELLAIMDIGAFDRIRDSAPKTGWAT